MGCGCGGTVAQEQWQVVAADGTVSPPMTKIEAQQQSQAQDGSWIRPVPTSSPVGVSS